MLPNKDISKNIFTDLELSYTLAIYNAISQSKMFADTLVSLNVLYKWEFYTKISTMHSLKLITMLVSAKPCTCI